jgi:hypothetical protein
MNINEAAIRDRLVEHGRILFDAPKAERIEFSGDPSADALINDLGKNPHAFVLGCLMALQKHSCHQGQGSLTTLMRRTLSL